MNYIYDILLNFNKQYYDFYDWDDNVIHIKRIPLFRINSLQMNVIFNNDIKINIENIQNKTEIFSNKKNKIEFSFVVATTNFTIALKLDKNGNVIERSSLLFEEEDEVLETIDALEEKNLNIEIISKIENNYLTRIENDIYNFIISEINKLIENKEENKLMYLYYECFNEKKENINEIIDILKKNLFSKFDKYGNTVYNFLKLTTGSK